jgi:hypothetical protein
MDTTQGEVTITVAVYGPAERYVMQKFQVIFNTLATIYYFKSQMLAMHYA